VFFWPLIASLSLFSHLIRRTPLLGTVRQVPSPIPLDCAYTPSRHHVELLQCWCADFAVRALRWCLQPVLESRGIVSLDDAKRIDDDLLVRVPPTAPPPPLNRTRSLLSVYPLALLPSHVPDPAALAAACSCIASKTCMWFGCGVSENEVYACPLPSAPPLCTAVECSA
jgi:hypothetical protein